MQCEALVLGGVGLLCGTVALHLDPLAVVEGLAWRGLLGQLFETRGTPAAVGGGADRDLCYAAGRGEGVKETT